MKMFNHWWLSNTTDSEMPILKWAAAILLVAVCIAFIHNLQDGNIARVISNFGAMLLVAAFAVGPGCWGVIEAAANSSARKSLTLIAAFGFILYISGLLAHYIRF